MIDYMEKTARRRSYENGIIENLRRLPQKFSEELLWELAKLVSNRQTAKDLRKANDSRGD